MTTKHQGISRHRLKDNPLESIYAKTWEEQAPRTLSYLIGLDYTQQDATVAATMIQWLGSPVGQSFVNECLEAFETWKEVHK